MISKLMIKINNLSDISIFAKNIALCLSPNFVIALNGNLGAGKTTLVRSILQELGVIGRIKSPTFTYVEPYQVGDTEIYHFDLYRFCDEIEWFDLGFDEYIKYNSICFIEWAERATMAIAKIDWKITIDIGNDEARAIRVVAITEEGSTCLEKLTKLVDGLFN
ncbi:MAG: tRNA (adenosine(37)-N6)-threonylcarbamoyltransferase complex ATPase subunit type 1 TsaE [Proteobacteria bacterium]|nr:tRNA (adenosine(37)-N6)-threonylcarbamoyltransferase complex ATPase subunit type 1 TsaE [Pseudomonadota bacterium]